MLGYHTARVPMLGDKPCMLLINAGVDASTLRQVEVLEKDVLPNGGVVVLLNCGLDRVSWLAKMGFARYLDSFEPAYYLKNVAGMGWLLKDGDGTWKVFINTSDGVVLVNTLLSRPKMVDVESMVRRERANVQQP